MTRVVLLLYALIVVAGGALIAFVNKEPEVKLVAARELPARHLLEPGDLHLFVDGRQYLARSIKEGESVKSSDIEILQGIVTTSGEIPVAVNVERDTVESLKIGSGDEIFLCPPNVRAKVRVAVCGDESAPCLIVAAIAVADNEAVKAAENLAVRTGDACK